MCSWNDAKYEDIIKYCYKKRKRLQNNCKNNSLYDSEYMIIPSQIKKELHTTEMWF